MTEHTVGEGECLASIAEDHGSFWRRSRISPAQRKRVEEVLEEIRTLPNWK
jgi:hypothetical protein